MATLAETLDITPEALPGQAKPMLRLVPAPAPTPVPAEEPAQSSGGDASAQVEYAPMYYI
jgi:hypothetical protein